MDIKSRTITGIRSADISQLDYILITNLMHWLLFIHKIIFSSTCFEPQELIFRRIQLYTCSIWYCRSLWEFLVACRYTAWVRTLLTYSQLMMHGQKNIKLFLNLLYGDFKLRRCEHTFKAIRSRLVQRLSRAYASWYNEHTVLWFCTIREESPAEAKFHDHGGTETCAKFYNSVFRFGELSCLYKQQERA